jgi:4-amino-4-deoxy-L-arabinose transferase-like glycosyltransferase
MAWLAGLRWFPWSPITGFGLILALVFAGVVLILPGIGQLSILDREEARFVQRSRDQFQAADAHGLTDGSSAFPSSLVHQFQISFVDLTQLPDNILPYRLMSAFGALVAALLVFGLGRSMFNQHVGWIASLATLGAPLVVWDAKQAKADMWLMAATVGTVWLVWRLWRGQCDQPVKRRAVAPLGVAVAFGVLVKGAVLPWMVILAALTLVVFDRSIHRLRAFRPLTAAFVVLVAILGWRMVSVPAQGWSSLMSTVNLEMLVPHGEEATAPGYRFIAHLLLLPLFLWPLSLFLLDAIRLCRVERDGPRLFLLAWIVPGWVMFELLPGKQWHHVMPLLPLLALLSASAMSTWMRVDTIGRNMMLALWGVLGAAMPTAVWLIWGNAMLADQFDPFAAGSALRFCVTLGISFFFLALALRFAALGKATAAVCAAIGMVAGTSCALCTQALPAHQGAWLTDAIVSALESASGRSPASPDGPMLGAVGYEEPSLVFATHGRAVMGVDAPWQWVQEGPDRWLLDDGSLGALPENLVLERQIRGYCISEGKRLNLRLIRPQ